MQKGFDVVIFEKSYLPHSNEQDEKAEVKAQKQQYQTQPSPFAAKDREKERYREEVLQRLKENHPKTPVLGETISIFNEYAKNEHASIKVSVNDSNMKVTIEISSSFLLEDDPKVDAFLKAHNRSPVVSCEDRRWFVYRVTFDLN